MQSNACRYCVGKRRVDREIVENPVYDYYLSPAAHGARSKPAPPSLAHVGLASGIGARKQSRGRRVLVSSPFRGVFLSRKTTKRAMQGLCRQRQQFDRRPAKGEISGASVLRLRTRSGPGHVCSSLLTQGFIGFKLERMCLRPCLGGSKQPFLRQFTNREWLSYLAYQLVLSSWRREIWFSSRCFTQEGSSTKAMGVAGSLPTCP